MTTSPDPYAQPDPAFAQPDPTLAQAQATAQSAPDPSRIFDPDLAKDAAASSEPAVPPMSEQLLSNAVAAAGLDEDELLVGAPLLRPVNTLRMTQRRPLMVLLSSLQSELADPDNPDEIQLDLDMLDPEVTDRVYELLERVDLAMEKLAVDPAVYAAWAVGENVEARVLLLFLRYGQQLGESTRSAG